MRTEFVSIKRKQSTLWHLRNNEGFLKYRHRIANVLELYSNGTPAKKISELTGVSYQIVCKWITKHWFGYRGYHSILIKLDSRV